ncbi:hypothetical protein J6590_005017 [Homalodisca vitripennis]|nr:hypothetical protein J6590_005017 [Homalodisca vitripennis]
MEYSCRFLSPSRENGGFVVKNQDMKNNADATNYFKSYSIVRSTACYSTASSPTPSTPPATASPPAPDTPVCSTPALDTTPSQPAEPRYVIMPTIPLVIIPDLKNVTVVGDSHCRVLVTFMRETTACHTNITGICKPGAGLLDVSPSHLNNVASRWHFELDLAAIDQCKRTSKALISLLPPRNDLPLNSSIHNSFLMVNNFISELCLRREGVRMIDLNMEYGYFLQTSNVY